MFEEIVRNYNFIYALECGISQPLCFYYKLDKILYIVEIIKDFPKRRYFLKYEIYGIKSYQFTFDEEFNIKPNQKSKFLKLESNIHSVIERSLFNTTTYHNLFGD